jgi:RHS repeat-associated protein
VLEYDARGRVREGSSTTTHDGRTLTYVSRRDARGTVLSDLRDGEGLVRMRLGTERTRTVLFGRFALEEQSRAEGSTLVGPSGAREDLYLRPDLRVERRLSNGTLELSQFDEEGFLTGRATHKRASDGAEVSWGVRYERSGEGDLASVWDSARGPVRYELDAAHRLVGVDRNGTRELIDLDPAGNVLGKRGLSRVELMEGNRLVATAEEEFVYDERQLLAGRRRRSDGRFTRYTYDSLNQLVRVEWRDATGTLVGEPWTADYDVLGRRVRFGRGKYQTELWWDGLRIAAEEELVVERGPDGSASTRRARLRIYGYPSLDALVPSGFVDYANRDATPASGAVYQVFTDPTGLPLAIEDARGETVWWATASHPYGDVEVHPSSRIDYAMRWPGHRLDATLGLFYNRFRDYDPSLARYLQTDPIGQRGGINVYAYCNNPLRSVDLLGLAGTHDQHTPNPAPDGDAASTTGHPHTEDPPDAATRRRDATGRYAADPNASASGRIGRDDVYPRAFRQSTHNRMAVLHTDEGQAHIAAHRANPSTVPAPPPVRSDAGTGRPLARDELTWRGADGVTEIPFYSRNPDGTLKRDRLGRPVTNLTYDHDPPLVNRYNDGGGFQMTQAQRDDDFNDASRLVPMSRSENSSDGASLGSTYRQDTPTF